MAWRGRRLFLLAATLLPLCGPVLATDAANDLRSVRQAYAALEARPAAVAYVANGWSVFSDDSAGKHMLWSFAPPGDPAYPAVVRREVLMKNGLPTVITRFVCEGQRQSCERLYARLRATGDVGIASRLQAP